MVPPPFEAKINCFLISDTELIARYPILLTVELRVSLLLFKTPLTSPFHKSFLIGLPPSPTLWKETKMCTPLVQQFKLFIYKNKKGPPSKKDGRPVVPPSLAKLQLTLPISKHTLLISVSCNDEIFAKAY